MDRIEEEERADAFVEIVARAAEAVEGGGFALQVRQSGGAAKGVERAVAERGVGRGDDAGELAHGRLSPGRRQLAHGQQLWKDAGESEDAYTNALRVISEAEAKIASAAHK